MAVSRASDVSRADYGVEIAVYGLAKTEKVLRQLAISGDGESGEVVQILNSEIRQALNVTRDNARKRIPSEPPMSGWSKNSVKRGRTRGGSGWPSWDAGKARGGIKVGKGQSSKAKSLTTISVAWRLESSDAAGTIYDKAGTKTQGSGSGVQFIKNIAAASGVNTPHQRVLWPAWLATRSEALASISTAIHKMEARFNAILDRMDSAA